MFYKITKRNVCKMDEEEGCIIRDLCKNTTLNNVHVLVIDNKISGFNPVDYFLREREGILDKEIEIINSLKEKREILSLFPEEKVTFYPIVLAYDSSDDYVFDTNNIDKHFDDILHLNDAIYKTNYMYVILGHGFRNFTEELLFEKLKNLIKKSKILEDIFVEIGG